MYLDSLRCWAICLYQKLSLRASSTIRFGSQPRFKYRSHKPELLLRQLGLIVISLTLWTNSAAQVSVISDTACITTTGGIAVNTLVNPPTAGTDVKLIFWTAGDLASLSEYYDVYSENGSLLGVVTSVSDCAPYDSTEITVPVDSFREWGADGSISFTLDASSAVGTFCITNCVYVVAQYTKADAANDAATLGINEGSGFVCSGSQMLNATVANVGINQIGSLAVNWSVNGVAQTAASITGTLDTIQGAGSYTQVVSLGSFSFVAGNTYVVKVWTSAPNGGVDTVNSNDTLTRTIKSGLSGSFTIGGASPDYASFTAAINDLKTKGICDSVIFNVRSNTYIEHINIGSIPGSNASAWVIFQSESGDSSDVMLTHNGTSSMRYTLGLDSTSYITFRNMTFRAENISYARVVYMQGPTMHVKFNNCRFIGQTGSTSTFRSIIYYETVNVYPEFHEYRNNRFENGSFGIDYHSVDASDGLKVISNHFVNPYYMGIEAIRADNALISKNMIYASNLYSNFYGIRLTSGLQTATVTGNSIIGSIGGYGIYINQAADMATPALVANNFISMGGSIYACYGINFASCSYYNAFHNTVNVHDNTHTGSRSLFISGGSNNKSYNNNLRGDQGVAYYVGSSFNVPESDYNNFFNENPPLTYWAGNHTDLAAMQSATSKDSNSISEDPFFLADTSFKVAQISLNNSAMPLPEVSMDIEMENRSLSMPDMGADEFSPPPVDAGVDELLVPECPFGPGSLPVYAVLKNYGSTTLTSVTINWEISGVAQTSVNWTGSLASGDTIKVLLANVNFMGLTNYSFKVYSSSPNAGSDAYAPNDTSSVMDVRPALGGTYTLGGASPDFATFADAALWLNNAGVYDSVKINVRVGTYTEQLELEVIKGADSVKTVCFMSESGDSSDTKLSFNPGSANNYIVHLNGTSWVRFKMLGLEVPTSFYTRLLLISGDASNNSFTNVLFNGNYSSNSTSTSRALVYHYASSTRMNTSFSYCHFEGGSYGIYDYSWTTLSDGYTIMNCRFKGNYYYGIYLRGHNSINVSYNTITPGNPAYIYYIGMYVLNADHGQIMSNQIFAGEYPGAMYLNDVDGSLATPFLVANNFLQAGGMTNNTSTVRLGSCNDLDFFFNSISSFNNQSFAPAMDFEFNTNVRFQNNIFQHNAGGYAISTDQNYTLTHSDYNNLFTTGPNIGRWAGANITNLAAWVSTTGLDSNSISIDAQFTDTNDLHVAASNLNAAAMPVSSVTMDIDKEGRDPVNPDIGADEFGLAADDAGIVSIDGPMKPFAPGSQAVEVSLLNNGAVSLNSVTINWEVNGVAQTPIAWTGSLASGATLPNVLLGNFIFAADSAYCIKAWTSLPNGNSDAQSNNDTTEKCEIYAGLSGIYTIGGVNPDYPDFTSAVAALHHGGVTGWVKFNVRDSVFNEQITINEICGADSVDTICFMGENDSLSAVVLRHINTSQSNFVLALYHAKYISFKHIDFKVGVTHSGYNPYSRCVVIDSASHYNSFKHCDFGTESTTLLNSSIAALVFVDARVPNSNISFYGCQFTGASYGVFWEGINNSNRDTNIRFEHCRFIDQYYRGIYTYYMYNLQILRNVITSSLESTSYRALDVYSTSKGAVSCNHIYNINRFGAYFSVADGLSMMDPFVISNNFIHLDGSIEGWALQVYASTNLLVAHNSVNVTNTHANTTAFQVNFNYSVRSYNNIFVNMNAGTAMRRTSSATNLTSDFNNYYVSAARLIQDWNSDYATLPLFVTATSLDSNSLSEDPQFTDTTDLHAANVNLDGSGMPVPQVTEDFDKEPRNPTNPDIGADEFATNSDDAGVVAIQYPNVPFPAGVNPVKVSVLNNGADTLKTVTINWSIDGVLQTPFAWSGSIAPGAILDSVMIGSNTFLVDSCYSIKAWTSLPNGNTDILALNDSAEISELLPALIGTYTIGGVSPDFPDFTSAVAALHKGGILGPVKFNVRDGVYAEQITIKDILGLSATDTICFMPETGDSSTVVLSFSANSTDRHTLRLEGTSYLTFKGIGFRGDHVSYGDVVTLDMGSHHIRFMNCAFDRSVSTSGSGLLIVNSNALNTDISVAYSQFTRGSYGIYEFGGGAHSTGLSIMQNRFLNQNYRGIEVSDFDNVHIYRNWMRNDQTASTAYIGIYLLDCNADVVISKNYINAPFRGDGILLSSCDGTLGNELIVDNNFVIVADSANVNYDVQGVYLYFCSHVKLYYNSIHSVSPHANSESLLLSGNDNVELKNNVVSNSGAGYSVYLSSGVVGFLSDFNDFFATGTNLTHYLGANQTDLAGWQSASSQDANSVSANPDFVAPNDLHMRQPLLDSAAMVIAGFTLDYDCQTRDTLKPDIGADEVLFFPDDLKMNALISPANECGLSNTATVTVEVFNAGNDDQTGFDITMVIDGVSVTENVGALNFPSRQFTQYTFTATFNLAAYKAYAVKTWTNLLDDIYRDNDTLVTSISNFPPPVIGITPDSAICKGNVINLMASGGVSYLWSNSLTGASIFVAPTFTTTYWVRVTDANGCVAYDTTTVTVSDSTDQVFLTTYTCDTSMVGVETVTLTNRGGCDSIVTTTILYAPPSHDTLSPIRICDNDSALIFGSYQNTAGYYYDTLVSVAGCDSVIVQQLLLDPSYKNILTDIAICDGDSALIFGAWRHTAGLYNQTMIGSNGCDSILCQSLIVNPNYTDSDTNIICEGDSIMLAGAYRTMTGVYPESFTSALGCDSTINHYLQVNPVLMTSQTLEICDGDSLFLEGAWQTVGGIYTDVFTSSKLCDSTVTTTLIVNPNYMANDTIRILQGDSVMVNGRWLSSAGDYIDTLTTTKNCDSIVVTTLILASPARSLSFSSNTNFTSSLISPLQGTPYNTFNFEVVYTDSSGSLPPFGFPRIILDYEGNGVYTNPNDRFVLLQEADVNDLDASDGKLYIGSINALPLGKNWEVLAQVIAGADNIILGPFDSPDILVEPDLQIFANDITFSNNNPAVSSPLTISAKITNVSDLPAQNFVVHLRNQNDTAAVFPDITIPNLGANSSTTVQWNITIPPDPSWNPMQVFVDYTDVIMETNELDNNAVRPFINGNYNVQGNIVVAANVSPLSVCAEPGKFVTVSGFAYYTNTAVQLSDSSVAGAEVNFSTNGAQYSTTTNSNGYFSLSVPAPLIQNVYVVNGTVTDFTLTGNFTTSFSIQDCPCTLPDLATNAIPRSITIFQGDSISGMFSVKNIGCAAAPLNLLSMTQNGGIPVVPNTNVPMLNVGDTFNYHINNIVFNTPGVYSICATADGGYIIQELNESNNSECILVRVLAPTIDLYPTGAPSGVGYICGNLRNPTISVRNGGTIASGPFVTKVRVYQHGVLVDSAYHSFASLGANSSASFSFPFIYSDTGNYAFEVLVDTNITNGGQVAEFSESNNYGLFNRRLIPCKPDLVIKGCRNLKVSPVDPAHPGAVTYQATVHNAGNDTAKAPIDVAFMVMPGLTHSTQILTDLAPGQSSLASVTVASVAPGTAVLKAIADPSDLIDEFSENNNSQMDSLCWEFQPVAPCGGGFWNRSHRINTLINVSVALKTLHLYEASSVDMKYEVSGPGISGTMNLGTFAVPDVKKDCGCPRVTSLPNGFIFAQPGIYTFTFTVDPNNVYSECNEANNVLVVNVEAYDAPDMRVLSQFINPSKLNPDVGESITIDVTYENIGVSNVNSQMELKVTVDNIPLDSIKPVPGLVTGDNTTFSIPASWFSNIPGAHIIRAIIDSDDELSEINELNNEATRAIVVGEAANLFFAHFMADDSSPSLGDTIDIDFNIGNNGDVDAMADVRISYVNDFLDTITIGTIPISVLKQDSTGLMSMPWVVADNNTTLVGEIINTNTLEWTYDDNVAYDSLGVYGVMITSAPSCFSTPNGWIKATPMGGLAPFNYSWSNGGTGDSISGGPGDYYVDITDADGVSVRAYGSIDTIPGSLTELAMAMMCQGDSMMIFGEWRHQAGVFYDTLSAQSGCDSILKQQLNLKPAFYTSESITMCDTLSMQVVQIDTLVAVNGCDSIHTTYINYMPASAGTLNMEICQGDSILIAGMYENTPGVYYDTLQSANGCDSIVTVNLNVVNPYFTNLAPQSICHGDSIMIFGQWQSTAGVYYDSLLGSAGCDSVLAIQLQFNPAYSTNQAAFICQGDSVYLAGSWQTMSGIYIDTLQTPAGCDSIITTDLNVGSGITYTVLASICQGDSIWAGGTWQTMAGLYYDTMSTASGCDSIKITDLSLWPVFNYNAQASICNGDSIYLGGAWQTMNGNYYDTLQSTHGCDSVITTNLNVGMGVVYSVLDSICQGDSVYLGGAWQNMAGLYYDTISTTSGCDSIRVTDLSILPVYTSNAQASICDVDSIYLGGAWQSAAGNYMDLFVSVSGCDSMHYTQLSILPNVSSQDTTYICAGDSALIGGMWQHVPGDYVNIYQAANGCDSTHTSSLIMRTTGCNVDCNGDIGGAAYLDSCGVCVGGNTGKQPCSSGCVSLEVVSFTLVDAASGLDVRNLYDGDTIDRRLIPSFSLRANTCGDSIIPGQVECITFDNGGLTAGNIPSSVVTTLGTGPIGVYGYNPGFPGTNAAMIFNSSAPTGGDFDLGTPNTDFGGPGIGSGGSQGSTYQNNLALNNLLVVSEDLDTTDANDLRGMGILEFDFATVGPVIVHSLTIVDIEGKEGPPMVRFYNSAGLLFSTISLNTVGNNGVANINFGPVAGVSRMTVHFGGSGAIDNLCIETPQTSGNGTVQLPGVPVGSVIFDVNGAFLTRENMPPYAIMGGSKTTYTPWNAGPGSYHVKATPYSSKNGKGIAGIPEQLNLVIVDGSSVPDCNGDAGGNAYIDSCGVCVGGNTGLTPCLPSCQTLEVTSFKLIDATNGTLIGQLNNGDTINRSNIGPFSIRAETCNGPVGSVLFHLNGLKVKKENSMPYDINGGPVSVPKPWMAPLGTHTLVATPYSNANGNGTAGIAETVMFTVIDPSNPRTGGDINGTVDNGQTGEGDGADHAANSLADNPSIEQVLMKVYPNPTQAHVNVDLLNHDTGDEELVLLDNTGKVIRVINDPALMTPGLLRFKLDISELPDGIYLLRLTAGDQLLDQRLIKQ